MGPKSTPMTMVCAYASWAFLISCTLLFQICFLCKPLLESPFFSLSVCCIAGGLIPLHNASSFGHAEVVSLLLAHGADPNARDNWNFTPFHEAATKGKIDVCIGRDAVNINTG